MAPTKVRPTTVTAYLKSLPPERRRPIEAVREVILDNLPAGYKEAVGWGMITYGIPLSEYPNTYNGQPLAIACLAAQKNHNSVYLMAAYGDPKLAKWLADAFKKAGKRLDMGKSCVRFKTADDLPLAAIGELIAKVPPAKYIAAYEASRRK